MLAFNSQSTVDDYSDALTLEGIPHSPGGSFIVTGADVFYRLQWGPPGQFVWGPDIHAGVGNGSLLPGTAGVQFKSFAKGTPAVVSAVLSGLGEPTVALTGSGQAAPAVKVNGVVGSVRSDGAILSGTGFTVAHSGTGVYLVSFTPALAVTPVVLATGINGSVVVSVAGPGINNVTVNVVDTGGAPIDNNFGFMAIAPQ